LQEINQDQKLWVRWHAEPLPDFEGPLYQNPDWLAEQQRIAQLENS
jgi:hypothetical protein